MLSSFGFVLTCLSTLSSLLYAAKCKTYSQLQGTISVTESPVLDHGKAGALNSRLKNPGVLLSINSAIPNTVPKPVAAPCGMNVTYARNTFNYMKRNAFLITLDYL